MTVLSGFCAENFVSGAEKHHSQRFFPLRALRSQRFLPLKTDILSGAEERATRYNWGRALCGAENPAEKNSGIFAAVQ